MTKVTVLFVCAIIAVVTGLALALYCWYITNRVYALEMQNDRKTELNIALNQRLEQANKDYDELLEDYNEILKENKELKNE